MSQDRTGQAGDGRFYIPRLDQLDTSGCLPLRMILFVVQFRAMFDVGSGVASRLELSQFDEVSDHLHVLARTPSGDDWKFERFAPFSAARTGLDLTGARVTDHRLAPYNDGLAGKLGRLSRDRLPFYVCTPIEQTDDGESHRLFIPMGKRKGAITHCLLLKL